MKSLKFAITAFLAFSFASLSFSQEEKKNIKKPEPVVRAIKKGEKPLRGEEKKFITPTVVAPVQKETEEIQK